MHNLLLSELNHTWILDLDGTIVKHNGYLQDGRDSFLPGAEAFLKRIPKDDMIVFITARKCMYKEITEKFLQDNGIRYDYVIYEAPYGERILINDDKPSGLQMAKAISVKRDEGLDVSFEEIEECSKNWR